MHLQINDLEIFFVLQILETTKIWNMFLKALRTASYKKNSQCKVENVRSFGNFSKGLSFNRSI